MCIRDRDEASQLMAENIIAFFRSEVAAGRLPKNLLPLQSGVGNVANAVMMGLAKSEFENMEFYSEVIQDAAFDLVDSGKFTVASGTAITPSQECLDKFLSLIHI